MLRRLLSFYFSYALKGAIVFFKGKSFIVKMVKDDDVENAESVQIDLDEAMNKVVQAGLIFMGAYFVGSTVRQLVTGFAPPAQIVNTVAPVFNNDNSSIVNFGGPMSKMVERESDGKIWKTITRCAAEEGVPLSWMSKHLNHYEGYDSHKGETYRIAGLATAA
jgi:hypothetical protein